jgi:hypothetical protein
MGASLTWQTHRLERDYQLRAATGPMSSGSAKTFSRLPWAQILETAMATRFDVQSN